MSIINIILRKMLNNRWLVGSLFLGLLITTALVSSIPTYSASVLSKLLIKELENFQIKNAEFPGEFSVIVDLPDKKVLNAKSFLDKLDKINTNVTKEANLPILKKVQVISTTPLAITQQASQSHTTYGSIKELNDIKKHIVITDGRFPSLTPKNGVYEALVPEIALKKRDIVLNTVLTAGEGKNQFFIKPVGTFKEKSERDPYWFTSLDSYSDDFIFPEQLFNNKFLQGKNNWIDNVRYYTAFDYHQIKEDKLVTLLGLENNARAAISQMTDSKVFISYPVHDILLQYKEKSSQLNTMLWSLNVPLLIMLGIYLFMVTRLIIDRQRNEIAILNSRGANRSQILIIYLIELSFLSLLALLIGPFLGLLLCKVLGATNGFLEFVDRSPLELRIMKEAFLYEFYAIIVCIVMMMIPIYQASNQSIVSHKRNIARIAGNASWYMVFFDIGLLGISLYGWSVFNRREQELLSISGNENTFSIDPLLFFVPAAFIIGTGLLCLRIYPYVLKGIFNLGKKFWSLSFYSTLVQVSRSSKQYGYLMVFLIMTIAVGVYSSSAARTINNNLEEQIRYENGADITVRTLWENENPTTVSQSPPNGSETGNENENVSADISQTIYSEPPFEPFLKLTGIDHAAKVFRKEGIDIEAKGQDLSSAELMAIEPKEFGQTAWFKPSLLPHHWFEYLNLLAREPSSVLISDSVAAKLGVKTGDYITISWGNSNKVEFVVYGIIKYWPGFNPNQVTDSEGGQTKPALVVANLPYVQNFLGLEPYEIWLKTKPNITRVSLYKDMKAKGISITDMSDVLPKLTELKNGAFLLGINGTLSLGFMISIMITFIGFLIFWILTMKSRILQYGIYRAMGIPLRQLIGILLYEQMFTSGVACALGVFVGILTSTIFVPLFQLSFNPKNVVPPFQVIFDTGDETRITILVIFILFIGLSILAYLLKNIRIHQAIKLGED